MAKTQKVAFGAAVAIVATGVAQALFSSREFGRRAFWIQNRGAAVMTVTLPSGATRVLAAAGTQGDVWEVTDAGLIEDGAYTITGTITQTYNFAEYY